MKLAAPSILSSPINANSPVFFQIFTSMRNYYEEKLFYNSSSKTCTMCTHCYLCKIAFLLYYPLNHVNNVAVQSIKYLSMSSSVFAETFNNGEESRDILLRAQVLIKTLKTDLQHTKRM